jgi:flagellar protein FlgJ
MGTIRMDAVNPIIQKTHAEPVDKADARLKKTCQEFEALLVAQMLSAMRETVPKSDLLGSREKEEIFQSMLDQETAVQMSRTGSLKLADMLYAQLSKIVKNESDSGQTPSPTSGKGTQDADIKPAGQ